MTSTRYFLFSGFQSPFFVWLFHRRETIYFRDSPSTPCLHKGKFPLDFDEK